MLRLQAFSPADPPPSSALSPAMPPARPQPPAVLPLPRRLHHAADHGPKPGGPLMLYRDLVSQGRLRHDTYQENVASELDTLLQKLERYEMEMEDYHAKLSTWDSSTEKERRRLLLEEAMGKQHDGGGGSMRRGGFSIS